MATSTYLVLSDLHLGDPRQNKIDAIIQLLLTEQYDVLILNGDIWDYWIEQDFNKMFLLYAKIILFLRYLSFIKKVVWVLGNHDPPEELAKKMLPSADICHSYVVRYDGEFACEVRHGHQMEKAWERLPRFVFKAGLFIYRLTRGAIDLLSILCEGRDVYKTIVRKVEQQFIETYTDSFSHVVVGHTHMPSLYTYAGMHFVNVGDWIYHSTYAIIQKDKEIELKTWKIGDKNGN
jgi:UDP-2,3-diacylglucosamine pyrophosphatase LpxH